MTLWTNWAGNQRTVAARELRPDSADELAAIIRAAAGDGGTVKAVGSGHSFTPAAITDGTRLFLDALAGPVRVDAATRRVTVGAGTTIRQLNQILAEHGLAMPNLGDIDAQTVAGAIATGTHGTGARLGGLATFVEALSFIDGTGMPRHCSATHEPELFAAARIGLGALGVLTEVTLRVDDAFTLHADERPMPLDTVLRDIDDLSWENEHFEFYWFPYTERTNTKRNNRVATSDRPLGRFRAWMDDDFLSNTLFGGVCRVGRRIPRLVPTISAVSARALSARSYTARSDEVFVTPRRVRFVEMEYSVPRAALREAFAGLRRVVDGLPFKVAFPVEVRFVAADDIWLSHSYGRDSAYIAIHQYVGMPYEEYFRGFEQVMTVLDGRPHWGKMHYLAAADLAPRYPHFDDFLAVRDRLDPERVFANAYTTRVLGK